MKRFILVCLSIGFISGAFTQCDVIDQPFNGNTIDTTSTTQQRNVLIEDWTGHRCKNCPKASKVISGLVDAFGEDRIIGLAIHGRPSSFTGVTSEYPTDFTTPEGKTIQNFFYGNSPPLPIGMLNRENWSATGSGHLTGRDNWPTLSSEAMDSTLRIALTASASVSAGTLNITVEGYPQLSILHDLNIVALIKESDIVSPQLMSDDTRDADYIHNNVLRDFITDPWGEGFGTSPMVSSDTLTSSFNMAWNNTWIKENSAVVVYVCHPDNYRILQVIEVPVN